jgi:hypothetical protein
MTIKNMTYIHTVLIQNEQQAAAVLKEEQTAFYRILDAMQEGTASREEYARAQERKDIAFKAHCRAEAALLEFERQEW